jgi:hypothetical protein
VTLPGERGSAPLGMPARSPAVLRRSATPTTHPALVIAVTAVAVMVRVLPHAVAGRAPSMDYLARRMLTVAFAAVLFRPLLSHTIHLDSHPLLVTAVMVGVVLATDCSTRPRRAGQRRQLRRAVPAGAARRAACAGGIGSAIGAAAC